MSYYNKGLFFVNPECSTQGDCILLHKMEAQDQNCGFRIPSSGKAETENCMVAFLLTLHGEDLANGPPHCKGSGKGHLSDAQEEERIDCWQALYCPSE